MKRVEINELHFKSLVNGVKNCVARDDSRPVLKYIQIKVKHDTITAYALDGYRAGRVEIKNTYKIDEEFTCLIKPFTFKVSNRGTNLVVIEQSDEKTFVEITTEYGVIRYGFDIPTDKFYDVENIYADARQHDRDLGVRSQYVIDAMRSLTGINSISGGSMVVIEGKENNKRPFIIRAKNDYVTNEQLILPIVF